MTTVSAFPCAAVSLSGSVTAPGVDLGAPPPGAVWSVLDESAPPRWGAPGSAGSAAGLFSSVGSDT
ncbi:hypothetical protein [Nocardia asteroides]|uniref:hypothetical protein n=1 Tax=Nocardia asteroides TaxID=1824 RepID=UPI001E615608|nr:hypothetical protein [Nocardia asteroides]UGT58259.1 hypothetical protein LTT85_16060 [Nocardia asteroides]